MKHITSLLLCLICWLPFGISGTPENGPERVQSEFTCNLPGPSDLAASNITTNSFNLNWTAVPGAWGYRVRVTDSNNNQVFDNTTTGTAMFVGGLAGGETYDVKVTSLCAVGNEGGSTELSVSTDIQIDIIAGSYDCPEIPFATTVVPQGNAPQRKIPFQRDVEYLAEFKTGGNSTFFTIKTGYEGRLVTTLTQKTLGNAGDLTDISNVFPIMPPYPTLSQVTQAIIAYQGNQGSQLKFTILNGDAGGAEIDTIILQNNIALNAKYFDIKECKSGGERGNDANLYSTFNKPDISIYPNPFEEQVQIQSVEDIINIRLFDTSGKQVNMNPFSTNDQRNVEINTTKLIPGVYYLSINTRTGTSFHKIVKI